MIRRIATSSEAWLQRHRDTHARSSAFGTHTHPYLLETIHEVARAARGEEAPSLLDYGCGKGVFTQRMRRSGWFRFVRGYDPAVDAFKDRPAQVYDVVLCLDVLDQLEAEFVDAAIRDVAQFTAHAAVFDVITRQVEALAHLNPRSAETWGELISAHMRIERLNVRASSIEELAQGACPERVIIVAAPAGS